VWRTTYNLAATAKPLALFVARTLEPMAKAGKHGAPMRIAFLRGKQMSALALSRAVTSELTFNGKSAIENGDAFREIVADDSAASYREAAGELTAFAPDIVLYLGGGAIFRGVVETAEAAWAARPGPRPLYAMATVLPDETFAFVGTHRDRRRRFFGMTTRSTTAPNAHFVMHFNESAEQKTSRTSCPNESYDAFYVLAYAALAAGSGPLTGSALSKGIARLLPPGRVVEVGPTGIFDAIDVLGHGERIDLEGATGKLDFDLAHGEAPVDFAVLCVDADAQGKAIGTIESGVVYDSTHQVLEGQLACP
jgi:ABC-type branched-subunit amino acid transport system substrate-binding protein